MIAATGGPGGGDAGIGDKPAVVLGDRFVAAGRGGEAPRVRLARATVSRTCRTCSRWRVSCSSTVATKTRRSPRCCTTAPKTREGRRRSRRFASASVPRRRDRGRLLRHLRHAEAAVAGQEGGVHRAPRRHGPRRLAGHAGRQGPQRPHDRRRPARTRARDPRPLHRRPGGHALVLRHARRAARVLAPGALADELVGLAAEMRALAER